ncbi:Uncharacterized [Syntrophomonas zehnderi OL-4]|uniref:Uncharacterized n=1 Tax=Syntrophomonas zehnderi OL-4 TaxID=690567 RepID=A0A0E4GEI8_9FIRM|nr:hypothetical protein [Syntrophomonas zehnderi]CFX90580.1 Uncharacterized [Syntrophomonas zehnderi OL-4]
MERKVIMEKLMEISNQDRITCAEARKLAEDLKIEKSEVGKACDEAGIKISACELGCF